MELVFLGTGAAWGLPEHSCKCRICNKMTELGEERTRTSLLIRGEESLLVDCGPDFRFQMRRTGMEKPDAILITHEHGDHYLGLDELLAYRRSMPPEQWSPIPVYATKESWEAIEVRFHYLLGTLLEKREAVPGEPLQGIQTRVIPFRTFHGPLVPGAVGYVMECPADNGSVRILYTSDFISLPEEPDFLKNPDFLVMQSHWLSEPKNNRPNHMSLQCALEYIQRWKPKQETFLVHISDADMVPGDPCNSQMKKLEPRDPLAHPDSGIPYPVPLCSDQWKDIAARIGQDYGLTCPLVVPSDGFTKRA